MASDSTQLECPDSLLRPGIPLPWPDEITERIQYQEIVEMDQNRDRFIEASEMNPDLIARDSGIPMGQARIFGENECVPPSEITPIWDDPDCPEEDQATLLINLKESDDKVKFELLVYSYELASWEPLFLYYEQQDPELCEGTVYFLQEDVCQQVSKETENEMLWLAVKNLSQMLYNKNTQISPAMGVEVFEHLQALLFQRNNLGKPATGETSEYNIHFTDQEIQSGFQERVLTAIKGNTTPRFIIPMDCAGRQITVLVTSEKELSQDDTDKIQEAVSNVSSKILFALARHPCPIPIVRLEVTENDVYQKIRPSWSIAFSQGDLRSIFFPRFTLDSDVSTLTKKLNHEFAHLVFSDFTGIRLTTQKMFVFCEEDKGKYRFEKMSPSFFPEYFVQKRTLALSSRRFKWQNFYMLKNISEFTAETALAYFRQSSFLHLMDQNLLRELYPEVYLAHKLFFDDGSATQYDFVAYHSESLTLYQRALASQARDWVLDPNTSPQDLSLFFRQLAENLGIGIFSVP